jgi:general secretion pathway protein L
MPDGLSAGRAELLLRRGVRETRLGSVVLDGGRAVLPGLAQRVRDVTLVVPLAAMLEQRVALPLAAERDPGQVLRYEMDRLTPFDAEAVFWSWGLARRDRVNRRIEVVLRLVPKAAVQPLVAALAAAGLAPTTLESGQRRIALASGGGVWPRRLAGALAAVCAGLAVAAVAIPFVRQELALQEVAARIAALRPKVAAAEALRARLATQVGSLGAIASEQARIGDVLRALAVLTETLPDDTYLTDLSLRSRRLTFGGRSEAAVRLIPLLAAGPVLGNPGFLAPVTRAPVDGREVFSITAELQR